MSLSIRTRAPGLALAALLLGGALAPAQAFPGFNKPAAGNLQTDAVVAEIDRALAEDRLVDAGRLLDRALAAGATDPRLMLESGELHLARGRLDDAVRSFTTAQASPGLRARALQGRGVALSRLGRSDEAIAVLQQAVQADPTLWRAWNALGAENDRQRGWTVAEAAYDKALTAPGVGAEVYNNRGYSRLLQGRYPEASADFVKALERDPALDAARTNLRLSLALQGDYGRATSVGAIDQRAAALNNAGFAALLRGDFDQAEGLFNQAIEVQGKFYARAHENLALARSLRSQAAAGRTATP